MSRVRAVLNHKLGQFILLLLLAFFLFLIGIPWLSWVVLALLLFIFGKLGQFIILLLLAFLLFQFGIPWLSSEITGTAAPVPAHLLWTIYMPLVVLVLLLFISANEQSWSEFRRPLRDLLVEQKPTSLVWLRRGLLVVIPLIAGLAAYLVIRPDVSAPPELRSIHPAPPSSVTVGGETIDLRSAVNPFRGADGADAMAEGQAVYGQNCVICHGDSLEGDGLFAASFRPRPADFTDPGTIAQLQESYLFWRIATGGPGLPAESKGWDSAMPAWGETLSADEIWKVILFLYEATDQLPRAVGE